MKKMIKKISFDFKLLQLFFYIRLCFLLQFKCDPKLLSKVKNLLEARQYNVLSADEDYVPNQLVILNKSDLEAVSFMREKILQLEDVNHINDNIAE